MLSPRSALWCVVLAGSVVRPAAAEFRPPLVIHGATVVPSPGQRIESGSILIRDGRIAAVGAEVESPPDAERLDASGLIVYAGFIDANTHAGIAEAEPSDAERSRMEDEIPDVRDSPHAATVAGHRRLVHPHWRAEERFDPQAAKLDDHRRAGFTVGLVSPRPAILSGRSAILALGDMPLRRSVLREGFAQHAAFVTGLTRRRPPADFPESFDQIRYPTTTMGAMAAFRQILLDAGWHRTLTGWSARHPEAERIPLDRDLEALHDALDGRQPVAFVANTENEIHRALDMAAEFGLRPVIIGAREAWRCVERLKREEVPVIVSLKWSPEPKRKGESGPTTRPAEEEALSDDLRPVFDERWEEQPWIPDRLFEERKRLWGEEVDNALRLHEAGVRFAIGSFEMESPGDVLANVREAIKRGLPEDTALGALTRDAAAVLGMGEQLGEIARGRLANLTLMTKPLADEKARVRCVFVDGKRYDVEAEAAGERRGRGGRRGGPRRGGGESRRGAPNDDEPEAAEDEERPTTSPATQPVPAPEYAVEIESDRAPRLRTGGNLLIRGATLLTISGEDLAETDLLIRDGKIAAIGRGLESPPGVAAIELAGYYVMPGMLDPHSHMCSDGGLNEFSLSVTCEVRVGDVVDHRDVQAYRALAGGVTTIHTMHGSANTIGGQNATLRLKYGRPAAEWLFREAPRTVKFALGENVKQSNFGRGGTRFPNSRMGVEAVLRRALDAARRYKTEWADYERGLAAGKDPKPPRRDLRLEALQAIHDGAIWVHTHCYRADEILRWLAVAEEYGIRIAVLQHVLEGYRVTPEIRRHGCGASTFSDWWAYKIEAFDAIPQNAARMIQEGVLATLNSDSAELVRHLNLEAAKTLRFGGLGVNDALRLVTLNAAQQLGVEAFVGSIEIGKYADLVVFDGHPLDTFSKCVLTLIDGEAYFQHRDFEPEHPAAPRPAHRFVAPGPPRVVRPSARGEYWITGGTVYPVTSGPIENGVVVISEGKIARVGRAGGEQPPEGATVIDASNLRVYPGLINAGTALGLIEISSVAGSVDVSDIGRFQPDLTAVSAYNPFSAAIGVTRSEGITSALVVASGGHVAGQAGLVRLDGWSMPEALIASPVGLCVSLPSLPDELPPDLKPDERQTRLREHQLQLAEIEKFFREARHYARVMTGADASWPEFDRRLEAMTPYLRRERPVLFSANGYKQIREALRFAERYGLRPVIYGGREAWKLAAELAAGKVDVILLGSMMYPGGEFEPWDSAYANAAALAEAGVRFCFATGGASLAKLLGVEAGMAVAHGLDRQRALEAITIDAARILGVEERLGSLEQGKVADVIVATDTPLQASSCVVAAFIGGRPIDLANKHTRTDAEFLARPAPRLGQEPELRGPPAMRLPLGKRG